MFNAQELLDRLMGSKMAPSADKRVEHAVGDKGLASSESPLSGLFSGAGAGAGGWLDSVSAFAKQAMGRVQGGVKANDPLTIGGLGAIAGALFGGSGGAAAGGGALAVLGSLAYSAMKPKQGDAAPSADEIAADAPLGLRPAKDASEEAALQAKAMLLIRAMINAAKADGAVDAEERQRIIGHLEKTGASGEALEFVTAEMARPLDTDAIVAEVTTVELAAEVYGASLLAIEVDTPAEEAYLANLARALKLPPEVVARIHTALGVPAVS